jgi:hypothetical protein
MLITWTLVVVRERRHRLRTSESSGVRGLRVARAGREEGGSEMRVLARLRADLESVGNKRWEYREGVAGKSWRKGSVCERSGCWMSEGVMRGPLEAARMASQRV